MNIFHTAELRVCVSQELVERLLAGGARRGPGGGLQLTSPQYLSQDGPPPGRRELCFLETSVSLPACGPRSFELRPMWPCVLALLSLGFLLWNRDNYFQETCPQDKQGFLPAPLPTSHLHPFIFQGTHINPSIHVGAPTEGGQSGNQSLKLHPLLQAGNPPQLEASVQLKKGL